MAMSDIGAEACVAYLLDFLVSDGRDPAEAAALVNQAINNWSQVHIPLNNHGNLEIKRKS